MSYDPNWLQKERMKNHKRQMANISHIEDKSRPSSALIHSTMLCGQGWGAKGHPSIRTVMYPSVDSLPSCRQCREIFLKSIGVEVDDKGYPKTNLI